MQLSAAAETVLAWTLHHAGERHQFGRPAAKFQAIQMQLAEMAGKVSAVSGLTHAAARRPERSKSIALAAAAAKVRAGEAVDVVAGLAHQVHGAIGFTRKHRLHHRTTRMWSWRDEAGHARAGRRRARTAGRGSPLGCDPTRLHSPCRAAEVVAFGGWWVSTGSRLR